jgi:hypothetical protein
VIRQRAQRIIKRAHKCPAEALGQHRITKRLLRWTEAALERDLLRRSAHSAGATPRYDWDAMYAWLFKRINDYGVPESQAALVGEVQEWFIRNSKSGKVPEDSTIRKRILMIWRILRGGK